MTDGIPQELVLEMLWFDIFVGGMDSEIECIHRKFVSETKMCGVIDMPALHPKGP